jgi:hypothetical protein
MLTPWDDEIDDLRSWEEVECFLRERWDMVRDDATGLLLTRGDSLLLDEPRSATAKQRRLLHRAGFRRVADDEPCWSWTPSVPEPSDRPGLSRMPPRMRAVFEAGLNEMARDRARNDMAVRVLRDVFGCVPENLVIELAAELDDSWDDDEDDLPAYADCATLEALPRRAPAGPGGRGVGR